LDIALDMTDRIADLDAANLETGSMFPEAEKHGSREIGWRDRTLGDFNF